MARPATRLLREFIHDALYHPKMGYFSSQKPLIFTPNIPFKELRNQEQYLKVLANQYDEAGESWATPSELFQPYYGEALANYVHRNMGRGETLQMFEIGAGRGTVAKNILDYFQTRAPTIYKSMSYTSIEISSELAAIQKSRVKHPKFQVERSDVFDWKQQIDTPCFVLGLEVLDNMPHDKLVFTKGTWCQTMIQQRPGANMEQISSAPAGELFEEQLIPVCDPLIRNYMNAFFKNRNEAQNHRPGLLRLVHTLKAWTKPQEGEIWWVPTRAYQLLSLLRDRFPQHRLIWSDFDLVTGPSKGKWAPTVMRGGAASFADYLEAPFGSVDIVFPTDFAVLAALWKQLNSERSGGLSGGKVLLQSPEEFLTVYADVKATRLRDGYNPLLLDYANTQFMLTL